jgi:hypothetical protein
MTLTYTTHTIQLIFLIVLSRIYAKIYITSLVWCDSVIFFGNSSCFIFPSSAIIKNIFSYRFTLKTFCHYYYYWLLTFIMSCYSLSIKCTLSLCIVCCSYLFYHENNFNMFHIVCCSFDKKAWKSIEFCYIMLSGF